MRERERRGEFEKRENAKYDLRKEYKCIYIHVHVPVRSRITPG